jgi:hypothetical protein
VVGGSQIIMRSEPLSVAHKTKSEIDIYEASIDRTRTGNPIGINIEINVISAQANSNGLKQRERAESKFKVEEKNFH